MKEKKRGEKLVRQEIQAGRGTLDRERGYVKRKVTELKQERHSQTLPEIQSSEIIIYASKRNRILSDWCCTRRNDRKRREQCRTDTWMT